MKSCSKNTCSNCFTTKLFTSWDTRVTGLIAGQYFVRFLISATSNCDDGWFQIGCSCFIVISSTTALTWNDAKEQCLNKRNNNDSVVTLAGINSSEEINILKAKLNGGDNWIGLHADANSSFLLPSGQKAEFLPPQVNNRPVNQKCIAIAPTNIWKARSCDADHRYICQGTGNGKLGHLQY